MPPRHVPKRANYCVLLCHAICPLMCGTQVTSMTSKLKALLPVFLSPFFSLFFFFFTLIIPTQNKWRRIFPWCSIEGPKKGGFQLGKVHLDQLNQPQLAFLLWMNQPHSTLIPGSWMLLLLLLPLWMPSILLEMTGNLSLPRMDFSNGHILTFFHLPPLETGLSGGSVSHLMDVMASIGDWTSH